MKCPKCSYEYADELEECPACYEPRPLASLYTYKKAIQKILHHPIIMVIAILFSAFALSYLGNLPGRPVLYLFPLVLSSLTAIGCWLMWAKSAKQEVSSGHFGLAETVPLLSYILMFVVLILAIVTAIFVLAYVDRFDVGSVISESWVGGLLGEEFTSSVTATIALGKTIFVLAVLLIVALVILMIVRYSRFFYIYDAVSKSLEGNNPPLLLKSSYIPLSWITAGIVFMLSFTMIEGSFLTALRMILYACAMVLASVLYMMYHKEIEAIYETYQQELGARKHREKMRAQAAPATVLTPQQILLQQQMMQQQMMQQQMMQQQMAQQQMAQQQMPQQQMMQQQMMQQPMMQQPMMQQQMPPSSAPNSLSNNDNDPNQ